MKSGIFIFPLLAATALTLFLPFGSQAQIPLVKPFGGRIIKTIPCNDGSLLITVGPPSPGLFMYRPGLSILFAFYLLRPGAYVLGIAGPAASVCTVGTSVVGGGLVIRLVGTSL